MYVTNDSNIYNIFLIISSAGIPLAISKLTSEYQAKKEYWDSKKTAWFFDLAGCIPVNRQTKDNDAKNAAVEVLKNGGAIGLFPEGTRNRTNEILLPFKFGAVSMANKTNSYLVPFGISGEYKFRSKDLIIEFGKPFKVKNDDLEGANKKLEKTVKNLILKNRKK